MHVFFNSLMQNFNIDLNKMKWNFGIIELKKTVFEQFSPILKYVKLCHLFRELKEVLKT